MSKVKTTQPASPTADYNLPPPRTAPVRANNGAPRTGKIDPFYYAYTKQQGAN
jgi:hypothetical protein